MRLFYTHLLVHEDNRASLAPATSMGLTVPRSTILDRVVVSKVLDKSRSLHTNFREGQTGRNAVVPKDSRTVASRELIQSASGFACMHGFGDHYQERLVGWSHTTLVVQYPTPAEVSCQGCVVSKSHTHSLCTDTPLSPMIPFPLLIFAQSPNLKHVAAPKLYVGVQSGVRNWQKRANIRSACFKSSYEPAGYGVIPPCKILCQILCQCARPRPH